MVFCEIVTGLVVFFVLLVIVADKLSRKPFDFKGKVVVLTGASSGIGEHLAYELASKSTKLLLVARREDLLRIVAQRCKDFGAQDVQIHVADVSEKRDNQSMVEAAQQHYGRIDALILNAGRGSLKRFEEVNEEDLNEYRDIMDVNYWGCVYGTYFALPYLKQSKGIIVVISSLAGKLGPPTRTGYAPTKFALHGFFNSLRTEVGSDVGITLVCPGFVLSQIHDRALGAREKGVSREMTQFMPTDVCARIVVEAAESGKREEVMTPIGKLGVYLLPFLPSLLDFVAIRKSKAAVKVQS